MTKKDYKKRKVENYVNRECNKEDIASVENITSTKDVKLITK